MNKKGMPGNTQESDYLNYSFEDFLQDDFFISSVKEPSEESEIFWTNFQDRGPDNIQEYVLAKQYLQSIAVPADPLSDDEISHMWNNISSHREENKKHKRGKLLFIAIGVAASIAVLVISFPFLMDIFSHKDASDIIAYADKNKVEVPDNSEIQLVISDNKTILFEEKEATITYNQNEIKTEKGVLEKEESVTIHQLIIPKGKRSVLTLSDGSKLWANAGSRVIYPSEFGKDKREIYVDGEIFVEVAKDANKPFFVRTKDMSVQALGTSFNVMAYESDALKRVVLVSGIVKVETKESKGTVLNPNTMFQSQGGDEKIIPVEADKYISWIKGLYLFRNERLGVVFERLSRYYGIKIECSPEASMIRCSGKLDLKDNIEEIMKGLSFDGKIIYSQDGNVYKINKGQ